MPIPFRQLKLGYASAEHESANYPTLLTDGYLNHFGLVEEALNSPKFLFLGYKGSGKSAINQHLVLTAKRDSQLFVTSTFLRDFPFVDFRNIIVGDDETKYPTAWSWILLLYLFASFSQDEGVLNNAGDEFYKAVEVLEQLGLLPLPELRQLVQVSSRKSFKLQFPQIAETVFEQVGQGQGLQIPFFTERLKSIAQTFTSDSKHILIIDGLDDILTGSSIQYDILASLVLETSRLNAMFQLAGTPAKIIILCRTDLYERLPGPNKNKLRQDSAVSLDWYNDAHEPNESDLVKLVNLRASLSDPTVTDIFSTYFPREIDAKPTATFLLNYTRHTPRDFIQILNHIQTLSGKGKLSLNQILNGVKSYSIEYFLPEIRDELVGYVEGYEVDCFFELVGSLRKRTFSFSELQEAADAHTRSSNLNLQRVVTTLFECSAIGNVCVTRTGMHRYTYKYRNRHATLNLNEMLCLHRGLQKAMNMG